MTYFVVEKAQGRNMRQSAGYSVYNHTDRLERQSGGRLVLGLTFFSSFTQSETPNFLDVATYMQGFLKEMCLLGDSKLIQVHSED